MSAPAIQSMTGFASVEGELNGARIRVELKSVNHRFLDLKVKLPRKLNPIELELRQFVTAALSRGSLELKLERLGFENETAQGLEPNLPLAEHYFRSLEDLRSRLGLTAPVTLSEVLRMPEIFSATETPSLDPESARKTFQELKPIISKGLAAFKASREREGSALALALDKNLLEIESRLKTVRSRRMECQQVLRSRVEDRVKTLFEDQRLASLTTREVLESRVAVELTLLLDRTDIEEELVRLEGHCEAFRATRNAGSPIGRKLDFLVQEMHREVNTLGNKAQDLPISREVVDLKVLVEQMREQVMNIE